MSLRWLFSLWDELDPRLTLRAAVEAYPDGEVTLDVTDLDENGWFQPGLDPREQAVTDVVSELANAAPAVVLTEGSTDAQILSSALTVLRPHLKGFLRFPDFSVGAEGGAAAEVRLLRALWASGIANRVVALFDNDTAAAEALRNFDRNGLPSNLRTLPPLPFGEEYPTVGPAGPATMDVNGLAGSIELYLGTDVLTDEDGARRPVQWTGYSRSMAQYQGELLDKASLHARFASKVAVARAAGSPQPGQDWAPLERVMDAIVTALSAG